MEDGVDMEQLILGVQGIKDSLASLRAQISAYEKALAERMQMLAKAIEEGETTGDAMRDLVIRFHQKDDDVLTAKYRAIDEALKGKKGEFVLVTFPGRRLVKHVFIGESEYAHVTYYRLGVLKNEGVTCPPRYRTSDQVAPTIDVSRYVEGEVGLLMKGDLSRPLSVVEENIFREFYSDHDPRPLYIILQEEGSWEDKIIIGDDAVKQWLDEVYMPGLYKPAADALSKLILEPTDDQ
ncbi:hypothetical protein HZC00_01555 [Candidatus Kaiserbacteria bacterium]|nr:hypothetical protein [Candidatus Kaiserbacteria bacterium]